MNVRWTAVGQNGKTADWAGDGTGKVLTIDESRAGFGPDGTPGPAALVQFNVRDGALTEWLSLDDLEELETASP